MPVKTEDYAAQVAALQSGTHREPHALLGTHPDGEVTVVRAFHPDAREAEVAHAGGVVPMRKVHGGGLFEAEVPGTLSGYRLRFRTDSAAWEADDPYRFLPTIGELDLYLIGEGNHRELWRRLGARVIEHQGVTGTSFTVWAPNARGIHLVSDANHWDERTWPMRSVGASGVWELFIPDIGEGTKYKFRVSRSDGQQVLKADPMARATEHPPATASVVDRSRFAWNDG
ncbi:MAG TPA: hypothetical protein VFA70_05845, partial [Dehalococcoidia bacterium]|nr:hypothetical protein [Dehalococcoidia bacterium]